MPKPTTFAEAIPVIVDLADKQYDLVHGDATTVVETDNGPVPSAAKAIADLNAEYAAQDAVALSFAARDAAKASATDAASSLAGAAAAAESAGSYDTLAQATAAIASIPLNAGVYVLSDGANTGFYVKQGAALVRKSDATVSALAARVARRPSRTWAIPFVDTSGKLVGGFTKTGRLTLTFGGDVANRLDALAVACAPVPAMLNRLMAAETGISGQQQALKPSSGSRSWSHHFLDKAGKIGLGIDRFGNLFSLGRNLTAGFDAIAGMQALIVAKSTGRSGYAIPFIDRTGRMAGGFTKAGRLKLLGRDVLSEIDALKTGAVSNAYISPTFNILTPGDSLTAGAFSQVTWREQLPALLTRTGRVMTSAAVGGRTSTQIALWLGAVKLQVTLQNNLLLAAGATAISSMQVMGTAGALVPIMPINSQGTQQIRGYLYNIPGSFIRVSGDATNSDAAATYTFLPDAGQVTADTPVDTNAPFEPTAFAGHDFDLIVMGLGRNNIADPATVKRDLLAIRDWQKTIEKRIVVITPPNGSGEGVGTSTYTNVLAIEQWAQSIFGDNAVLSRQILLRHGDPSNAQDVANVANGIVPASLTMDGLHWTTIAHGYVAAAVAKIINRKGW